jgi:hypothetical protein
VATSVPEDDGPHHHPVAILDVERCTDEVEFLPAEQAIGLLQLLVDGDAAREQRLMDTSALARDTRERP